MTDETIVSGDVQLDTASTAATDVEIKDDVTKTEAEKSAEATAEGGKPDAAKTEADEAAKASEAGKELASRKKSANERIAEVTRKWRDSERREQLALKEAADLRAKLKEPNPADFDDVSELTAAKVAHTLDSRDVKRLESTAVSEREQAQVHKLETFREKSVDARERYTDFDEVVIKPARLPMSQDTQSIILDMDESADVIYHLAKNPQEAQRIDRLTDREKAFELGKIAAKITTAPPRKVTQAAAPIESVGGKSSGGAGFNPEKASVEEFSERYRLKKEKERA